LKQGELIPTAQSLRELMGENAFRSFLKNRFYRSEIRRRRTQYNLRLGRLGGAPVEPGRCHGRWEWAWSSNQGKQRGRESNLTISVQIRHQKPSLPNARTAPRRLTPGNLGIPRPRPTSPLPTEPVPGPLPGTRGSHP